MTDKKIVLELTKAVIEKQNMLQNISSEQEALKVGQSIAKLFNTIATNISQTLSDLEKPNEHIV